VLDTASPVARPVADAFAGKRDLAAIHIIAQGTPEMCIAAGIRRPHDDAGRGISLCSAARANGWLQLRQQQPSKQQDCEMPLPLTLAAPGQPVTIYGSYTGGTQAGRYFLGVRRYGKPEVIGQFSVPAGHQGGTFVKRALLSPGAYTIGGSGDTDGDISVYTATFDPAPGTWTLDAVDRAITASLSGTAAIPQTDAVGAAGRG
jgi:hypothetical protein